MSKRKQKSGKQVDKPTNYINLIAAILNLLAAILAIAKMNS